MLRPLSQDDQITLLVFSGLELVCAVIMLVAAARLLKAYLRASRMVRVPGRVVAHQEHRTTMRSRSYGSRQVTLRKAVVRFSSPGGQEIDVLHPVASDTPPAIGTPVPVDVDPRRPAKAEVASRLTRYLGPAITLAAVGLVLIILVSVELSILS